MITEHIQFSFSVSCQLLGDLYATRTRWRWDTLLSEPLNYLIDQPEQAYNSYGRKKNVQQSRQQGFAWLQQAAFRQADNFSYCLGCYDKTEPRKSPLGRNFQGVSGQSKAGAVNAQGDNAHFQQSFQVVMPTQIFPRRGRKLWSWYPRQVLDVLPGLQTNPICIILQFDH